MKKLLKLRHAFIVVSFAMIVAACKDDDPLPASISDFDVANTVIEAWHPVKFRNKSVNAATFEWDFGDGEFSTEVSPSHTFDAPGTYDVTLTAITEDGQESIAVIPVEVGQRFLIGIDILRFPDLNPEGNNPNLALLFVPSNAQDLVPGEFYISPILENIGKNPDFQFPYEIPWDQDDVIPVTNQSYDFILFDVNLETETDTFLNGVGFNPVTRPGFLLSVRNNQSSADVAMYKIPVQLAQNDGALFEFYFIVTLP